MRNYDENSAVRSLSKCGCKVDAVRKVIEIPKNTIGIHCWGKVDFLCHHCGFTFLMVKSIGKSKVNKNVEAREQRKQQKQEQHKLKDKRNERKIKV